MKKIKILIIILIAVVGALLIYKHFEKIKPEEIELNKFSTEYTLVPEDNIYVYRSIDEIIDILENKTGVIPRTHQEIRECSMELSGEELQRIQVGTKELDFGQIFKNSENSKTFWMKII